MQEKSFLANRIRPIELRNLTTFITYRGCYRYNKVPFGLIGGKPGIVCCMDNMVMLGTFLMKFIPNSEEKDKTGETEKSFNDMKEQWKVSP